MKQAIINEFQRASEAGEPYSSDDIEALEQLKAVKEIVQGDVSSGDALEFLSEIGKLTFIAAAALDTSNPVLQNKARAIMLNLTAGKPFRFSRQKMRDNLSQMVELGVFTDDEELQLLSLGHEDVYPFASATLRLVRQARNKTNSKTYGWNARQRHLKITVNGELFEPVTPTITLTNDAYTDEPINITRLIEGSTVTIPLQNAIQLYSSNSKLTVELGAPNNFTVELVA